MRKGNWRISGCCRTVRDCTASLINIPSKSSEQRNGGLRRVHGLQFPLHPQQVVGWIALFGIAVGTFTVVLPYLGPNFQPLASALIGVTFSLHIAAHLLALLLDPADPKVRAQSSSKIVPEFDRRKHHHVIENGRCHLCNINTSNKRTKHCSICNKCIEKFDHHCKWLNNCIGGRNYPAFIVCVVSAVISALVVTGLSLTEIAIVNIDWNIINNWQMQLNMDNVTLPIAQTPPGTGSLIVISLVGIFSAIAAVLLIHLCFFHGYIACLGLTTYEYVRNKRERKIAKGVLSEERRINDEETRASNCSSFLCNDSVKNNANNDNMNKGLRCQLDKNNKSSSSTSSLPNDYDDNCSGGGGGERSAVYICSTHEGESFHTDSNGDARKDRRNFHLYFSYETRGSETSIEVSSQTILNEDNNVIDERNQESIEFKPSTPSPVSCCFSIINIKSTNGDKLKDVQQTNSDKERGPRSCHAMRRIQSFLRTRLRRNSRQRSLNSELQTNRSRKNKVNPTGSSGDNNSRGIESPKSPISSTSSSTSRDDKRLRPPLKLPPLVLPPRHKIKQIPSTTIDVAPPISYNSNPVTIVPPKRCQPPLRIRRTSFYKRPRFKMGPHVTETAQLSPIPESEFSKPASPKTPPQINHFPFPPPSNGITFNNDTNT